MGFLVRYSIYAVLASCVFYVLLNIPFVEDPTKSWKPGKAHVWGKSDSKQTEVKPFKVKVSDELLADLKTRLANWRQPTPSFEGIGYEYGLPSQTLATVVKYWRESYDWRKAEETINALPQFQTVIHGLNVHFVHAKGDPSAKKRVPLLLVHGWPGSFFEFYKVIPLLTANKNGLSFDVVAPSIPGYTFSEAPTKPGFGQFETAELFQALMARLGYEKFIYQGGDWGSIVGNLMAHMFPDKVIGYHTNMPVPPVANFGDALHLAVGVALPSLIFGPDGASKISLDKIGWILQESGYFHEQATKPDTIGIGLSDSPVGLAGYLLEKFATWSQHVQYKSGKGLTTDEVLTNIMLYWITNHITPSVRYYKEDSQSNNQAWLSLSFGTVPTAISCYPGEIICLSRNTAKRNMPRLVHYADMPRGGHFAAFEEPELFNEDFRKAAAAFIAIRAEEDKWGAGMGLGI